jgi:hypothetical protein
VSRDGGNESDNLLLLNVVRHRAYHNAFRRKNGKERTLEEVIRLLVRVHRIKGRCLGSKLGQPCRLAPCLDARSIAKSNGHVKKLKVVAV